MPGRFSELRFRTKQEPERLSRDLRDLTFLIEDAQADGFESALVPDVAFRARPEIQAVAIRAVLPLMTLANYPSFDDRELHEPAIYFTGLDASRARMTPPLEHVASCR